MKVVIVLAIAITFACVSVSEAASLYDDCSGKCVPRPSCPESDLLEGYCSPSYWYVCCKNSGRADRLHVEKAVDA